MSPETNPAANAVRHGLAGTRHVLPEHRELVKKIEKDLTQIFQPESPDEQELMAEMALHKFRVGEIDRQQLERDQLYKAKADEIAERRAREKFESLAKDLEENPSLYMDAFKMHHLGADYAALAWEQVAESAAADGAGVTIEMAWEAVKVEGRNPHVLHTSGPGGWLMGRVLAAAADPDEAIAAWLAKSGSRNSKTAASRARTFMQLSANAEIARKELLERATEKRRFWTEWAESRLASFNEYKAMFAETVESGDEQLDRDERLAHRYRTWNQNQFNALLRRFDNQRAAKLKQFRWTHDYQLKEKQHADKIEVAAAGLSRDASARYSAIREREFSTIPSDTQQTHQPIRYQCGNDIDFNDYNSDDGQTMQIQDSASPNASLVHNPSGQEMKQNRTREEDRASLKRVLQTLDGGQWLGQFEKVKSSKLELLMFQSWPDEILLDHPAAFGEMLVERETEPDRKMRVAQLVVAAAKYRQISSQVEKEQAERRKAGPKMKDGRYVFPLMSDLEDEVNRRLAE